MNRDKWPFWYAGYRFFCAPFKATEYWFGNLKSFFRRGRMGWAPIDVWDTDSYLGQVIPKMLHYLAENGCSCCAEYVAKYPNDEDAAFQAWRDDLNRIANLIEFANSDQDDHNKYAKEYWDIALNKPVNDPMPEGKEWLKKAYYDENAAIYKKQEAAIKEAMSWIGEHWFMFWD